MTNNDYPDPENCEHNTITADTLTHSDIGRLINDLHQVRNRFGRYEDDYRQAKIDVAIQQLEDIGELIAELQAADEWEDPDLYGVSHADEHTPEYVPRQVRERD